MSEQKAVATARTKLYTPTGLMVEVTIPAGEPITPEQWAGMLTSLLNAKTVGWLPAPIGSDDELQEDVEYVVLREKQNKNGTITPIVDLYGPNRPDLKFCLFSQYLNTDNEIAEFEHISGLRLADLPLYVGENKIVRGTNARADALIIRANHPFSVVHEPNPKHDPNETDPAKKKPARKFVRWVSDRLRPSQTPAAAPQQQAGRPPQQQPQADPIRDQIRFAEDAKRLRDAAVIGLEAMKRVWGSMAVDSRKANEELKISLVARLNVQQQRPQGGQQASRYPAQTPPAETQEIPW
jgi:hypothetical protein